jgi:hypothetical protein
VLGEVLGELVPVGLVPVGGQVAGCALTCEESGAGQLFVIVPVGWLLGSVLGMVEADGLTGCGVMLVSVVLPIDVSLPVVICPFMSLVLGLGGVIGVAWVSLRNGVLVDVDGGGVEGVVVDGVVVTDGCAVVSVAFGNSDDGCGFSERPVTVALPPTPLRAVPRCVRVVVVLRWVDRFRLLRSVTPGVWTPVSVVVGMLASVDGACAGVVSAVESVVVVVLFALVSYSFS